MLIYWRVTHDNPHVKNGRVCWDSPPDTLESPSRPWGDGAKAQATIGDDEKLLDDMTLHCGKLT